jgi:FHS family L-fucose permease-like MFS transporter
MLAACFVTMDFSRPEQPERVSSNDSPEAVPRVDRLAFIAICAATFTYVGVETALTVFVVDHATTDLGLSAARAARAISAFWGGLFVGRLAAGLSPQSPGAGMTACLATIAAAILVLFESGLFGSAEVAMVAIGLALGGVFPVMISLAGRALPSSPATAVGLAGGLGSAGGFIIPWATGGLASTLGLPFAFASLAGWIVLLTAAATIVHFRRPRSKSVS